MNRGIGIAVALAVIGLWAASLLLPAVQPAQDDIYPGYRMLYLGWMGVFDLQFGWLANPLLLLATVLLVIEGASKWLVKSTGVLLGILLLDALTWREMYYDEGTRPLIAYFAGYYCWVVAVGLGAAALIAKPLPRNARRD